MKQKLISLALTAFVLGSINTYAATSESATADDKTEQVSANAKKEVKKTVAKITRSKAHTKAGIKKSTCKLSMEKAVADTTGFHRGKPEGIKTRICIDSIKTKNPGHE